MVSWDRVRELALALPEAAEQDHHGRPSFRVAGKIFATRWDEQHLNVMLDEGGIRTAIDVAPAACSEVWWGRRLAAVRVDLRLVAVEQLRDLLADAWETKAPRRLVVPAGGPQATDRALARADGVEAVLLVEGFSDQLALETLAARHGRDLEEERVLVLPIGGAQAIGRFLRRFAGVKVAGLCDVGEESVFRRGLERAGYGAGLTRAAMERLGFFVCVVDLEDELIRALGPRGVEAVLEAQGDIGSFRTFQKQPAWRDRPVAAQLRRYLTSADRRKLRYAKLLVEAMPLAQVPEPLAGVLEHLRRRDS